MTSRSNGASIQQATHGPHGTQTTQPPPSACSSVAVSTCISMLSLSPLPAPATTRCGAPAPSTVGRLWTTPLSSPSAGLPNLPQPRSSLAADFPSTPSPHVASTLAEHAGPDGPGRAGGADPALPLQRCSPLPFGLLAGSGLAGPDGVTGSGVRCPRLDVSSVGGAHSPTLTGGRPGLDAGT